MTTGALEVTTLQLRFYGGGGGGGEGGARGPLTLRGRTLWGCPMTTGAQEVTTMDELLLEEELLEDP